MPENMRNSSEPMTKPVPFMHQRFGHKPKLVMDFCDMCHWIDYRYGINQRDYKKAHAFDTRKAYRERVGCSEQAERMYTTSPVHFTETEVLVQDAVRELLKQYSKEHPYCDFWHFQLKASFLHFSNDSYCTLRLWEQHIRAMKGPEWIREIDDMWVTEFSQYTIREGDIDVWVSW